MLIPDSPAFVAMIGNLIAAGSALLSAKHRESDAFDAWFAADDDASLHEEYMNAARRRRLCMFDFDTAMYVVRGKCASASDRLAVYDALSERGAHDVARLAEFAFMKP
jgi:hypothetical protein